jgi:hypothetical protein
MSIFTEGGKPENPEKNPRSKGENQQQTQLTYDTKSGNRTQVAVVRGKRSNRYATHASQPLFQALIITYTTALHWFLHIKLKMQIKTAINEICKYIGQFMKITFIFKTLVHIENYKITVIKSK